MKSYLVGQHRSSEDVVIYTPISINNIKIDLVANPDPKSTAALRIVLETNMYHHIPLLYDGQILAAQAGISFLSSGGKPMSDGEWYDLIDVKLNAEDEVLIGNYIKDYLGRKYADVSATS